MEPISAKLGVWRAGAELVGVFGASVFALTISTAEVALAVTFGGLAVSVIVWLVRLEGRVNTLTELVRHALGQHGDNEPTPHPPRARGRSLRTWFAALGSALLSGGAMC